MRDCKLGKRGWAKWEEEKKELLVFKHEASLDGVHAGVRSVSHGDLKRRECPRGETKDFGETKGKSGRRREKMMSVVYKRSGLLLLY